MDPKQYYAMCSKTEKDKCFEFTYMWNPQKNLTNEQR